MSGYRSSLASRSERKPLKIVPAIQPSNFPFQKHAVKNPNILA